MELYNGDIYLLNCILRQSQSVVSNKRASLHLSQKNFCPACLDDRLVSAHCYENWFRRSGVQNTYRAIVHI